MRKIQLQDQEKPFCPATMTSPRHPVHRAADTHGDLLYTLAEPLRDEDGEYSDPTITKIMDAAYQSDSMDLFAVEVQPVHEGFKLEGVEAWFFLCPTCGFVLPAQPRYRK